MPHDRNAAPLPSDTPTPGFYKTRLARGAPWTPARIMHSEDGWLCLIRGKPTAKTLHADPWQVPRMDTVAWSKRITQAEYDRLMNDHDEITDPAAPIDWRNFNPTF